MKKAIQRVLVLSVAAMGFAAWASPAEKPAKQPDQKRVKLTDEQLKKVNGAGDFHNGHGWKSHDNGGGNNPPNHKHGN